MKCFNHADHDAVGVCMSCGKGVCHDCLVEIPDGIACKDGNCERRARRNSQMLDNNAEVLSKSNQLVMRQAQFLLLLGTLFTCLGLGVLVFDPRAWMLYVMMLGFGFLGLVHGLVMRRRKNQYPTVEAK